MLVRQIEITNPNTLDVVGMVDVILVDELAHYESFDLDGNIIGTFTQMTNAKRAVHNLSY